MKIPSTIIAGDSVSWRDVSGVDGLGQSVDSGSYTLTYSFRGPTPAANVDVVATAYGTGWQAALTAAQTAAFNAGSADTTWYWQAKASKGGTVVTLGKGTLRVQPSPSAASTGTAYDERSQAEKDLAAVVAAISARLNNDTPLKYTIGNRSLEKEPLEALRAMRDDLKRTVARERRAQMIANGMGNPTRVGVRFK